MTQFAKHHYEEIANVILLANLDVENMQEHKGIDHVVSLLIKTFERDNPRFDAKRFRAACEPGKLFEVALENVTTPHPNPKHGPWKDCK